RKWRDERAEHETGAPRGCPGLVPGRLTLAVYRARRRIFRDAPGLSRGRSRWPLPSPPVETNVSHPGTSPGHPRTTAEGRLGRSQREPPRDKPGASKAKDEPNTMPLGGEGDRGDREPCHVAERVTGRCPLYIAL